MIVYGRYGNTRENVPAGASFFDAINIGSGDYQPRSAGYGLLWHMAPPLFPGATIATATVTASGLRCCPFVTPSFIKPKLAGVGIRLENATVGNPGASGIFSLWDGVAGPNNKYPGVKLWQSESIDMSASGYYVRYPNVALDRGQTYWLGFLNSRNATVAGIPVTGFGLSLGSTNALPTAQANTCISVAYNFHAGLTGLPQFYPLGGAHQTTAATGPIIWYALTEA